LTRILEFGITNRFKTQGNRNSFMPLTKSAKRSKSEVGIQESGRWGEEEGEFKIQSSKFKVETLKL
jgi:hypothetical protein